MDQMMLTDSSVEAVTRATVEAREAIEAGAGVVETTTKPSQHETQNL
jgi:hypothetical protein